MLGFSVLRNMLHVHKNTEGISDLWSHMTKGRNWKLICVFIIVISINTVKVCNKQHLIRERKSEYAMREKAVLTMVNHPFIIKLFYTFQDVERLCILLPIQNSFNEFLFLFLAVFFMFAHFLRSVLIVPWQEIIDFVLEYTSKKDLSHYLKKLSSFDLPCSRFYAAEIVEALDYLQNVGIIHRFVYKNNGIVL